MTSSTSELIALLSEQSDHIDPPTSLSDNMTVKDVIRYLRSREGKVGRGLVFLEFLEFLATSANTGLNNDDYTDLKAALIKNGWLKPLFELPPESFTPLHHKITATKPLMIKAVINRYLGLLGFQQQDDLAWLTFIFQNIFLPALKRPVTEIHDIDAVLNIEHRVYSALIRRVETAEHFSSVYQAMSGALLRAGMAYNKEPSPVPVRHKRPRIGFLFHSGAILAHTANYLEFLKGLTALPAPPIEAIAVIILGDMDEESPPLEAAIKDYGLQFVSRRFDRKTSYSTMTLSWLQSVIREQDLESLVFVSVPLMVSTISASKIAPCTIWWSMKYHQLSAPDLDGHLTYGAYGETERVIDGTQWRAVFPALTDLKDDSAADKAKSYRANLHAQGARTILGCFGREQKLYDPDFIDALARILKSCPDSVYLWSGRSDDQTVRRQMQEHGISGQCPWIGWVNTKAAIHILDIYADSFPFASGHTAYEAMAAGRPLVVLVTPESRETSIATSLLPTLERTVKNADMQDAVVEIFSDKPGDLAYSPFVYSIDDYVTRTIHLIQNPALRHAVGAAGKVFVETYLNDSARYAQDVCEQIIDIMALKK